MQDQPLPQAAALAGVADGSAQDTQKRLHTEGIYGQDSTGRRDYHRQQGGGFLVLRTLRKAVYSEVGEAGHMFGDSWNVDFILQK